MVLAKLLSRVKSDPLQSGARLSLNDLDSRLDVTTEQFGKTAIKLARRFLAAKATLDLEGHREQRACSVKAAGIADFPDVRGTPYLDDLRRLPPMDREEEFRMARRHEFLVVLLTEVLARFGIEELAAAELLRLPARDLITRLRALDAPRDLDRDWAEAMVLQYEQLRNLYVEGALHIVLTTVNRYRGLGVDTADLIQEGNASLFQAIDGFDWRRDVRFRTYAQYWVHQAVLKMLYNSSRTVRVPIWVQKLLGKIRRVQQAGRRDGRELTAAEIGQRLDIPTERVEWVLATRRYAVSIDAELGGEEGSTLAQRLPDEALEPIPDSIQPGNLVQVLGEVMADLPVREQGILRRRFGLDGDEPQTLGEIAADLGITAERVRQLQNAAIARIKRPAKLKQLQAFVE
ncbi:MAG: sigma-70 family RNA polymerase sigma factor [Planctomycetes bacterium]|nr:sigma-70 family RNA polymerase sigma factor [Planctomycetota bacterium]MCC7396022.1 sigma-70 family RNA polymerase sigma factor [Planctomycetota bacterium]